MFLNKISDLYKKFEKWISPVGLIYGFIFTSLTLTRVDNFLENFWIVMHLLIAGFGILALTYFEKRAELKNKSEEERAKFHFYLTLVIQFAFGGLFSTFFVFYMRSSSLTDSWFFLFLLLVLLVGNELWKKYYERLAFQISVLFVSIYLFLVFLLPVLFHRLGADLFIAAGILSAILIFLFVSLLRRITKEKFEGSHHMLKFSVTGIFILMNILYFTNLIPPIPLSLTEAGVYHKIVKTAEGGYRATAETTSWRDYFRRYPVYHKTAGEAVYAFSAIFSPVNFTTKIIHQWQYYDETKGEWQDFSKITLPISGGREEGFRTYSYIRSVPAGLWRVRVTNELGQVLGNIKFRVVTGLPVPALVDRAL